MADHREECSNDITLENLTCSVQIYNYRGLRIFAEKVAKEHALRWLA